MLTRSDISNQSGLLDRGRRATRTGARNGSARRLVFRCASDPAVLMGIGAVWTLATLIRPAAPDLANQIDSAKRTVRRRPGISGRMSIDVLRRPKSPKRWITEGEDIPMRPADDAPGEQVRR